MKFSIAFLTLLMIVAWIPAIGQDQTSIAPPEVYTGNFGFGLAVTGGNTDTRSYNLSFDVTRDPKLKNVIKADGFYLRSSADGEATADMLRLGLRDEYSLSKRVLIYGALGYLRDPFKDIIYLINPQGGIGYKIYDTDAVTLALSGGAGGVWEKNSGVDVSASCTVNAGENFSYKLSENAKLTHIFTALWKTSDFSDALYHFDVALAASIVKNIGINVEFTDDFKNVTPDPSIKKNDTAFVTSVQYKF
jgi:putative salt-induced outer membrane protein